MPRKESKVTKKKVKKETVAEEQKEVVALTDEEKSFIENTVMSHPETRIQEERTPAVPTIKRYVFWSRYNNINLTKDVTVNGLKVVISEKNAADIHTAINSLIDDVKMTFKVREEDDVKRTLRTLFGDSMNVDIIDDVNTVTKDTITL